MQAPPQRASRLLRASAVALALTGFSAVVGQILLLRQLIVVFNGNEMSLGIMLAAWLLWTATGSALASLIAPRLRTPQSAVAALELLLAASLPASLWILSTARDWFASVPGQLMGPVPMALTSFASLSLFCILSGALFVAAARMRSRENTASSYAYMIEAAGSALGGLLASLLFLPFLNPFQIAFLLSLLNLSTAAALLVRPTRWKLPTAVAVAAFSAAPLFLLAAPALQNSALAHLWRGFHLLASRDSIYGNLAVTETGSIRSIYSNGVLIANAPDEESAEEAVHYALLEHPAPRRVLLIGGGINGAIAQALKHPTVQRIDYVELDPALISIARRFLPAATALFATGDESQALKGHDFSRAVGSSKTDVALAAEGWFSNPSGSGRRFLAADPRVHLHFADGRSYLRATHDRFDTILLDVPDPQTAQLNRFYTLEFFRSARGHLAPGGILALKLTSSEETISPDLAAFLRCIQRTLSEVFPSTAAIPGGTLHLFAASQPGILTEDPRILIARLHQRNLATQYVREYFIPYRMMPDRMDQVHARLRPLPSTPINRDFAPVAYYFDIVLWSSQFHSGWSRNFRALAQIPYARILALTAALSLALLLLAFLPRHRDRPAAASVASVAATGFTLMALEVFLLLAFQSIYGYLYHQLAILIGLLMAGIAFGSWLALRRAPSRAASPCRAMAGVQLLLALACPALILAAGLLARLAAPAASWIAAQLLFPALAALAGVIGGYQFPIATEVFLAAAPRRGLGTLYAVDLLGGCIGALLLSTWLIPVFGFWPTAWLCALLNLAPALLALNAARPAGPTPA